MNDHDKRLIDAMLENAACMLSDEERGCYDPTWLAGYVAAMIHATETVFELATADDLAA
ncbi:hypothetical protein [Thermophilibacter provencensis]|uniref:Uncharacterized protein n=1 Tax=Thermophilibacter provencensis TaxID=1852386 RepID=A0ABT7V190_9ACTN|nr:hypothetical protein [Thermophilibacter provencensis]MDM8270367.1 hypothetical protein [Thermophilibacter provencensis]